MDPTWPSQSNADYYIPSPDDDFSHDMLSLFPFDDSVFQASADPQSRSRTTADNSSPLTPFDPTATGTSSPFLNPQADTSADIWLFNPTTGEVGANPPPNELRAPSKRSRGPVADGISACWTSPLCPRKRPDGTPPDSCEGECADFLFAPPPELPDDKKSVLDMLAKSQPRVVLESPPPQRQRGLKRQGTASTPDASGRDLRGTAFFPGLGAASGAAAPGSPARSSTASTARPDDDLPAEAAAPAPARPGGRVPHTQVERKYRLNVNAQLDALRRVVPVSRQRLVGFDGGLPPPPDLEDVAGAAARAPSKAVVLASATAYIRQLEAENARLREEARELRGQNGTLQSLVKCDGCSLMDYVKKWKIQGSAS